MLPKAEKSTNNMKLTSYFKAISQWLFDEKLYEPYFTNFNDIVLDYLLQMAMSGESVYLFIFLQKF